MKIKNDIYKTLLCEIPSYSEPEAYASDFALSSIWEDAHEADIPAERFRCLMELYRIAYLSVREIISESGLTQTGLANRFGIPLRTVQGWTAPADTKAHRDCPVYIRLMMAECLGLLPFEVV